MAIWGFVFRRMGAGGPGETFMSFGKSRAKLLAEAHGRVTFEDVAGVDEAKQDLQEGATGEGNDTLILGGRFPCFDRGQAALFDDQFHTFAIKTDLDLAAVSHGDGFGKPLLEGRLDMMEEANQVRDTHV